jgi:hypothetical protein
MKKTTLYLDPDVDRALAQRAVEQGLSKAELMRRALAEAARPPRRRTPRGLGEFRSTDGWTAEQTDEYLEQSDFGEWESR